MGKKVETCGNYAEKESCEKLAAITGNNPDAAQNLRIKMSPVQDHEDKPDGIL